MEVKQNFKIEGYFDNFIEKYKEHPITFWCDHPATFDQIDSNRINLFFAHEPNELFGIHTWLVDGNWKMYDGVISWSKELVSNIDNGIEFPCSWRMNSDPHWEFLGDKKFETTFLSGNKNILKGHKLRLNIFNLKDKIKTPHRWYYVLEDWDPNTETRPGYNEYSKDLSYLPEGFKFEPSIYGKKHLYQNSMFNVGVENLEHENWGSDRAWSCFASKVVPIYWGCPNLEEFGYDERGIIRFKDEKELLSILNNLTEKDYYDRLPFIEHNYEINKTDTIEDKLSFVIDELIRLNNL